MFFKKSKEEIERLRWKVRSLEEQNKTLKAEFDTGMKLLRQHLVRVKNKEDLLTEMLSDLYDRGIGSVLVEGGAKTLEGFINLALWDEARVFTSLARFKKGVSAPKFESADKPTISTKIADDVLNIYRNIDLINK